ncbi:1285_t:CDS:2 [Funneliformis geosporum]|uniref:1285_t:CDS:1 n=1 Tax=Funneliformis geosporum TaxID=1117311 RepID=A0A9W4T553_9GLOM|nr:1285_t:CDS:2 [Funneliformis geosporum]
MAKTIQETMSNLGQAYDLVITDLVRKLKKMKEGVIKLGDLHKKQRIIKRSALTGKAYAYYQVRIAVLCVGLYFYGQQTKDNNYLKHLPTIGGLPNNQNNQPNGFQQANQSQTNFQGQPNAQTQQPPSIIMKLMTSCLPVLLEQFTGQAMPSMGGNQQVELVLSQVISLQQQIITGQQKIDQRLTQLETSASQQFTGLAQEVKSIKSIRLTHDRERKQIEFNGTQQEN